MEMFLLQKRSVCGCVSSCWFFLQASEPTVPRLRCSLSGLSAPPDLLTHLELQWRYAGWHLRYMTKFWTVCRFLSPWEPQRRAILGQSFALFDSQWQLNSAVNFVSLHISHLSSGALSRSLKPGRDLKCIFLLFNSFWHNRTKRLGQNWPVFHANGVQKPVQMLF